MFQHMNFFPNFTVVGIFQKEHQIFSSLLVKQVKGVGTQRMLLKKVSDTESVKMALGHFVTVAFHYTIILST
jgi:hypothetical protein